MEKKQLKQAAVNGLRKNCFVRDVSTVLASQTSSTIKTYVSLDERKLPTGSYFVLVEKDYPINSDSVSSYADGADYRRDPLTAIANAPKRVNLGDVSEVQRFLRENPMQAAMQYRDILRKVEAFSKAIEENAATQPPTEKKEGE